MEFYPFPALLQSSYNDVYEFGQAAAVAGDDAVDFTGDFVPLIPLGTPAKISWIMADRRVAAYEGQVYLSSPGLLRIVGVEAAAMRQLRSTFACNTRLPAEIAPAAGPSKGSPPPPCSPAQIICLAQRALTLRTPLLAEPGSQLLLNCEVDFLTLRELPLLVWRRVTLRRQENLLQCHIKASSQENLIALAAYSARLEHLDAED